MSGREHWSNPKAPGPRTARAPCGSFSCCRRGCSCSSGSSPPRAARITRRASSTGVHSPPSGVGDYLFTIFLLIIVVMMLFLIWLWFSERDMLVQQRTRQSGSMRLLAFLALFAVVAAGLTHLRDLGIGGSKTDPSQVAPPGKTAKALKDAQKQKVAERTRVQVAPHLHRHGRGARGARLDRRADVAARASRRSRRRMPSSSSSRSSSRTRSPTSTPRWTRARRSSRRMPASSGSSRRTASAATRRRRRSSTSSASLPELRASGAALDRLTDLFEWAKFSAHDVDPRCATRRSGTPRGARRAAREPARGRDPSGEEAARHEGQGSVRARPR